MSWIDRLVGRDEVEKNERGTTVNRKRPRLQMPPQKPPRQAKDGRELLHVPAGEFLMGEDRRVVYVEGFYIAKYLVTNAEYLVFWQEMHSKNPDLKLPAHWEKGIYPPKLANHPVVNINWHEAMLYARWAGCRLPTEAEWEKAARGVDGRLYPWGDEFDTDKCNTREAGIDSTTAVNRYSAGRSPYGAFDMAGNVWEWQADSVGNQKVIRGGSWFSTREEVTCLSHDLVDSGLKDIYVGFRLAF